MAIEYTNRKGQTYYLHQKANASGNLTFHFSLQRPDEPVDAIPSGYEIYESPNGLAFMRKIRPKVIADNEVRLVSEELQRHRHLKHCRVDVKGKTITVYTPNQDIDAITALVTGVAGKARVDMQSLLGRTITYSAEMRFVLADDEKRLFVLERYCYLGSIDGWIDVAELAVLPKLVKYLKHLGKESFFELS